MPNYDTNLANDIKENFLLKFPKLETLELVYPPFNPEYQNLTGLKYLKTYSCKGLRGLQFPALPESIRRLEIANCPFFVCSPPSMAPDPTDVNISHLEELRFSNCNSSHSRTQHILTRLDFLETPRKLHSLGLNGMPVDTSEIVDALIERGFAESLVDLSLGNNHSFNDAVLQKMVHFTKLERLDISMTTVTGVGIVNLLRKLGPEEVAKVPWKWVGLDGCNNVSDETVKKMKGMGMAVDHKVEF